MSYETIRELQGYGFFIFLVVSVIVLYGYWFHLKKSEKTGRRNYEKYSKLALEDSIEDIVLEPKNPNATLKEK